MREFCIRLRNLVHSGATKEEISATQDSMMEEVIIITGYFVTLLKNSENVPIC